VLQFLRPWSRDEIDCIIPDLPYYHICDAVIQISKLKYDYEMNPSLFVFCLKRASHKLVLSCERRFNSNQLPRATYEFLTQHVLLDLGRCGGVSVCVRCMKQAES
jgi:hypothetical protein